MLTTFTVNNENKLEFTITHRDSRDFYKLFSTKQINAPELVWNDETRQEMLDKISTQIRSLLDDVQYTSNSKKKDDNDLPELFCNKLHDFEYTVFKKELRILDIFVKYFNNDFSKSGFQDDFDKQKKQNFAAELI